MSPPEGTIRLGVIGLSTSEKGWAGTLLSPLFPGSPLASKYAVTALCTTTAASATAAAEKYAEVFKHPVKHYYGPEGAKAIANDPNVDVVAVVVNVGDHKAAVLPALEKGKDVFVEWPLGKNVKETLEIAELARKKGVRTMVGAQGIQSPVVRKIAEVIKSGGIGRVLSSTVIGNSPAELGYWGSVINPRSFTADADSGASFLDVAVGHFLTYFTFALGDFTSVSSTLVSQWPTAPIVVNGKPTGETVRQTGATQIAFSGTLKSGAVASFHFRAGISSENKGQTPFVWLIDGEQGSIRVESSAPNGSFVHIIRPRLFISGEEWTPAVEPAPYVGNVALAWEEFAKGKEGSYSTFEDAVRVHRLIHAIRRSSDEGRKITL